MKVRNDDIAWNTHKELETLLSRFREETNFNADEWIESKVNLIKDYCETFSIKAAVLGISGGIDSAVVLGLLIRAGLHVEPISMPAFKSGGVTGQQEGADRSTLVVEHFGLKLKVLELDAILVEAERALNNALGYETSTWSRGQLVSYMRTPLVYQAATLLTDAGKRAVVVGTTNYSEGAYMGYVGKACDLMVDVQPLADLFKSEVYAVAEKLGVHPSAIDATPKGDVYDGSTDEEIFGATYDLVELHHRLLELPVEQREDILIGLSVEARETYAKAEKNIEQLHSYNSHKYLVGSPSVYLDVLDRKTYEGHWKKQIWKKAQ